ncbi:MAG: cation-translocating P-type ATPase [candidate division WOR-3 bacterium]
MKKLILPVRGMTCNSCARTVENVLKSKGFGEVSVDFASGRAVILVDNPEKLQEAGKELRDFGYVISYGEITVKLPDADYDALKKVAAELENLDGVIKVDVETVGNRLFVFYSPLQVSEESILRMVKKSGYTYEIEGEGIKRERGLTLFQRFLISLPPTLLVLLGHHLGIKPFDNTVLQGILATFVVLFAGYPIIKSGIMGFLKLSLNMNSLIALGTISALISLNFEPAAVIITLILFGKSLEERIRGLAYRELGSLVEGIPKFANVKKNGSISRVYVGEVEEGDIVIVRSGERVPVDGVVIDGRAEVSLAVLTGETRPVSISKGDKIYAGAVLINGFLEVKVEGVGSDTFIGRLKELALKSQEEKNRVQRLADKISAYFTVAVLTIALITFLGWALSGNINKGILSAISVMVVACPCALGIATPVAIAVAFSRSIKRGILIKHPEVLERAKNINVVAFDKTGTLTEGKPKVVGFEGDERTLPYISSLASKSSHPYSRAIYEFLNGESLKVEEFRDVPGSGIEGIVEGKRVKVGKGDFVGVKDEGLFGCVEGMGCVKFLVDDRVKEAALKCVEDLRNMGLKVFIISGDNEENTRKVAETLDVDGYFSNILPDEKVKMVELLREKFGKVAFVGDGINDAPVLASSDMGIAVGNATDLAALSGDIIIIRGDIDRVPEVIRISRKAYRRILQNLFWAFFYNSLLIPLASFGFVPPELSAMAMSLSSITVVFNSLRQ